jgi:hypothetical protein
MSPTLIFIQVPEAKPVKNRLHLDVSPIDGSTEDEVTRLLGLGATKTDVGQGSDGNWVVMADLEGNESCVLRTPAPVTAPQLALTDWCQPGRQSARLAGAGEVVCHNRSPHDAQPRRIS